MGWPDSPIVTRSRWCTGPSNWMPGHRVRPRRCCRLLTLLYRANFADERSAFDPARLLELGVAAGLDEREVGAVLADETLFAAQVRADEREAAELGANGVPFFVFDRGIGVSGAQQAETFTRALERAWSARSPLVTVAAEDAESCGPDGC